MYFSSAHAPVNEPILVLNGDHDGPINSLCVPSLLSPELAPPGRHLISISFRSDESTDERAVMTQAAVWFGDLVDDWSLLRRYDISRALPVQPSGSGVCPGGVLEQDGLLICGDHTGHSSIQSALESGRSAATRCLAET